MSGERALVVGALGRMGERVRAALAEEQTLRLGGALEAPNHPGLGRVLEEGVRVGDDAKDCLASCEVAIVFTIPEATLSFLRDAAEATVPSKIANVVTLIPPPVEPGAAPINISNSPNISVDSRTCEKSTVLKPAVRGVTD